MKTYPRAPTTMIVVTPNLAEPAIYSKYIQIDIGIDIKRVFEKHK